MISVGEPIPTAGMSLRQADELTELLRATIERLKHSEGVAAAETSDAGAAHAGV